MFCCDVCHFHKSLQCFFAIFCRNFPLTLITSYPIFHSSPRKLPRVYGSGCITAITILLALYKTILLDKGGHTTINYIRLHHSMCNKSPHINIEITDARYDSDRHSCVHRVFAEMEHPHRHWPHDWTRNQCVTYLCTVTLRCWRPIFTVLDDGTQLPVHTVMELMKQQNIWCYTVRRINRLDESRGPTSNTIEATQDACGTSWRKSGR